MLAASRTLPLRARPVDADRRPDRPRRVARSRHCVEGEVGSNGVGIGSRIRYWRPKEVLRECEVLHTFHGWKVRGGNRRLDSLRLENVV